MNLLHGDHTIFETEESIPLNVTPGYEVGSPCTILVKERAYDMYSWRTIDV